MGKSLKGKELGQGIRQRKDGIYEGRYKIGGVSHSVYSDNLEKLRYKLINAKARAHSDLSQLLNDATLDTWFDDWFEHYKKRSVKATSATTIKTRYQNNFSKALGDRKVKDIKPIDIQIVLNQMQEKGRKTSYIKNVFSELKDCLNYAVSNKIIDVNPCLDAMVPKDDLPPVDHRFLTMEEQNTFLEFVKSDFAWYYPLFYVMFATGMRVGEVGGLTWDDVDFKNNCFHIRHSLVYDYQKGNGKKMYLGTPKTKTSYRTIPFIDGVREMMIKQKEQQRFQKVKLGYRWRQKIDNVCFTTGMGSEVGRAACNYTIGAIVKKLNNVNRNNPDFVEFKNFSPHVIRHTFCSRCYQVGIDVKVAQKIMGHSSTAITLDCYTHFAQETLIEAMEKFGKMC